MGITSYDIQLLDKIIEQYKPSNVIELGAQNLYNQPTLPAPYANEYYEAKGIKYSCIDLSKENNCLVIDLSKPVDTKKLGKFDLVTDFGTQEHVGDNGKFSWESIYNCWKTKHELCKLNGLIISENPKTGNWPGHGFQYFTLGFYTALAAIQSYEIILLEDNPAMGNTNDGWNITCVLQKNYDDEFMDLETFKELDLRTI